MLTKRKRRILFYASLLAFLALVAPILLYSTGYGINRDFKILRTGGIFIKASQPGAEVAVNGKIKRTSLLGYSALIKNLLPGSHEVKVKKEGYLEWKKNLQVKSRLIASRDVLLIPNEITGKILGTSSPEKKLALPKLPGMKKYWELDSGDFLIFGDDKKFYRYKSGKAEPLEENYFFPEAADALKNSEKSIMAGGDQRIIFWNERNIDSVWIGSNENRPVWQEENLIKIFTSRPGASIGEVFEYPDWPDWLLISIQNGIFALEMDSAGGPASSAGGQNIFPIYKGKMPEIAFVDAGRLILKDDGNFIELEIP